MTFRMLSLLGLRKFSKFSKQIVARNFFQGISRTKLFGLYKKFPTLVKNFKNLKSRVSGFKRIFFVFFSLLLYLGQIPLMLMESACKKKFTRLTHVSTPPTQGRPNVNKGFSVVHQNLVYIKNENLVYIRKGI